MILLLCGGNHRLAAALHSAAAFFAVGDWSARLRSPRGRDAGAGLCARCSCDGNDPLTTICAALSRSALCKTHGRLERGLQLSFASTTGIVFFAGGLYRSLSENRLLAHLRRKDGARLCGAMLTAFAARSRLWYSRFLTAIQFWNRLACRAGRERDGAVDALYRFLRRNAYGAACAGASGGSWCLRMGAQLAGAAGAADRAGRSKTSVRGALS